MKDKIHDAKAGIPAEDTKQDGKERIYDYWVATLQDGYIGNIIQLTQKAGGARALYEMGRKEMMQRLGIREKLAAYIEDNRISTEGLERAYAAMGAAGISYVNHTDREFPEKLKNIPSCPYGLFVKGELPDPSAPAVAVIGARECSEYGRLMAEYFGNRLAKEGVPIISGMAWGIDGWAQKAALDAGGRSYGILGCGPDIVYPSANRSLYMRLCENGNGIISEYAPATPARPQGFPPRNRIISALCDVLIVVEARRKSGTLITVDMAIDQGKTVMVVPGRLTDDLSAGCINLLYQGALPATGIDAVLEQLNIKRQMSISDIQDDCEKKKTKDALPAEFARVEKILTLDPQSIGQIAYKAKLSENETMIILTKLELQGISKEVFPGFFVKIIEKLLC